MGRQLSTDQLMRLEKHSYSCSNSSLLDPLMQKLWCWLVELCPMWLAPNLITITGLIINILTCLILIYYSPDAKQEVPCWTSFLCAFGLFVYQSLDAIDGKQARRTGTSSPLGELFDHGCDSLSTVFVSLSVCCAVQLGTHSYWMFVQCLMAVTLFYCAHWQTYVSGTLRFGYIDVTEAQFGVIIILLISGVMGSNFWSSKNVQFPPQRWGKHIKGDHLGQEVYQTLVLPKIPSIGLSFKCLPTVFGTTAGSVAFFNNFKVILIERGAGRNGSTVAILGSYVDYKDIYIAVGLSQFFLQIRPYIPCILWEGAGKNGSTVAIPCIGKPLRNIVACGSMVFQFHLAYSYMHLLLLSGTGKNGSTVAGTSVLSPIVPLFLMVAPAIVVAWKSPYGIFLSNPSLYLLTFGFVAARVTNRLVVAHMTKSEMAYTDASMLGPAALFLNQYFNCPISEQLLLWIVCIYVTCDLIKYCREVCLDICDHLGISLFIITPRPLKDRHLHSGNENGNWSNKHNSKSKPKGKPC